MSDVWLLCCRAELCAAAPLPPRCSIEPGCVRIRAETILPRPAALAAGDASDAMEAASALLNGPASDFFAANGFSVSRGGSVVTYEPAATAGGRAGSSGLVPPDARLRSSQAPPPPPRLPPLAPMAVCSALSTRLAFQPDSPQRPAFRARFHGAFLTAASEAKGGGVALAATRLTGVALFEPAELPTHCRAPLPRPVLLTPNAAVAAEARRCAAQSLVAAPLSVAPSSGKAACSVLGRASTAFDALVTRTGCEQASVVWWASTESS